MARKCQVCGKKVSVGYKISKAHNLTKRRFKPNIHIISVKINGGSKRMKVCSRCIRSGKITKNV